MSSNTIRLEPGAQPVPGHRLVRVLGQGGTGQVWLAEGQGGFSRALKFLPAAERCADREMQSLELLKNVAHPHLIAILGFWQIPGFLVVGMELADEGSLWDRFVEARQAGEMGIPRHELLDYFQQAARAIDFLESRSLQHGDIKPQNLLRMGDGLKVSDFGQVRLLEHTVTAHTGAGVTFAYSPPEFLNRQTARQSDQYALAATWCHLRGGRLPFTGTPAQVMAGHMQQPPDLSMLPEEERAAVSRALAKNPADRWPSCRAFVEALQRNKAPASGSERFDSWSLPIDSSSPIPTQVELPSSASLPERRTIVLPEPRAKLKRPRRIVGPILALLVVVVALATVAAWSLSRPGKDRIAEKTKDNDDKSKARDAGNEASKAWEKEITNSIGMQLVRIPPGKFKMGSPDGEKVRMGNEKQHEVEITKAFWLGIHEVTQKQFQEVMGYNPSYFSKDGKGSTALQYPESKPAGGKDKVPADTSAFPVENVSWHEANEFCSRLSKLPEEKVGGRNYRLPTQAEWEYSCRGGAPSYQVFHFGNSLSSKQANFDGNYPYGGANKDEYLARTCKVGSYAKNGFGLGDMHGNVWEWCADWFDEGYYAISPREDPPGPAKGDFRVFRGGCWGNNGSGCRSANRHWDAPAYRSRSLGFRVLSVPLAR